MTDIIANTIVVTDSDEDDKCGFDYKEFKKHAKIPRNRKDEVENIRSSITKDDDIYCVDGLESIMEYLNSVEQPEQRTKEWFDYRHEVVTASSASNIFGGKGGYDAYKKEKILPLKHFQGGDACKHGVQFEEVAQNIYQNITQTTVGEYGCIRHQTISHLGASPDGIVIESKDPKLAGRMLEIKCLYSRPLTGVPLYKYWVQCQLQMEVCNLEFCDFFECKIDETLTKTEFNECMNNTDFYGIVIEYKNLSDYPKLYNKYSAISNTKEYYDVWIDYVLDKLIADDDVFTISMKFWKLNKYSLKTIKRDRDWFDKVKPDIDTFWEEVEDIRQIIDDDPDKQNELFPEVKKKFVDPYPQEYMFIDDE